MDWTKLASKQNILVGMSGGVDSSVTAALLVNAGHNVTGITMKIWDDNCNIKLSEVSHKHTCFGPGEHEDIADAQRVCDLLRIKLIVVDLAKEYRETVIKYFKEEYLAGRTPNPCVKCNHRMKFGFLVEKAIEMNIDFNYFATGHYARLKYDDVVKRTLLLRGEDRLKDQSYFLSFLTQEQLTKALFPLGNTSKNIVWNIAKQLILPVSEKKESQDFIEGGDYTALFDTPPPPGPIIDEKGNIIGKHKGIIHYTIGQRKGLNVASTKPLYVKKIDREQNALIVGDSTSLFAENFIASDINWIALNNLQIEKRAYVKIRQTHKEALATLIPISSNKVKVIFDEAQMIATPGQICVFYDDIDTNVVIGAGVIN